MTFYDAIEQALKGHGFVFGDPVCMDDDLRFVAVGPGEMVEVGVHEEGTVFVGDQSSSKDCVSFDLYAPDSIQQLLVFMDKCMEYECYECPVKRKVLHGQ
jgi:hypothetical protein